LFFLSTYLFQASEKSRVFFLRTHFLKSDSSLLCVSEARHCCVLTLIRFHLNAALSSQCLCSKTLLLIIHVQYNKTKQKTSLLALSLFEPALLFTPPHFRFSFRLCLFCFNLAPFFFFAVLLFKTFYTIFALHNKLKPLKKKVSIKFPINYSS